MDKLEAQASGRPFCFCGCNTPEHLRHPPAEIKLEALHRRFELGETVQKVADELGYSTASILIGEKHIFRKVRQR